MNKIVLWLIIAIIVVIVSIVGVFLYPIVHISSQNPISGSSQANVVVTEENFPSYLSTTNLVNDLPSDASILLKTEKKTYAVQKGSVTEGSIDNPDIIITIPSSYIPKKSKGFCSTMQEAKRNGDLGFQLNIAATSAAWKYRALYQYKSCLGL